ncbi:hypothetical protein CRM22_005262 [Opisthorchis felineus]|uniref:CutA1 divalent ion tolerance protein n=2 Tax=Opisthorchis felineus TaxID=147828 RepID=A0A4S2LRX6_OPIFE|nr:hypothetical protein CRM22_005262 [Opisthorchis felineus]TGZ66540.1 hypothetical protein CRM22_005262 [Opisthorchis felineus]
MDSTSILFVLCILGLYHNLFKGSVSSMHSIAYVTCPNETVANKIASLLVTSKLAACVNIIPSIQSIYTWNGKVEKDSELLLLIKTQTSLMERVIETVKSNHPYECPEVIATEIKSGYPGYLQWITDSTSN